MKHKGLPIDPQNWGTLKKNVPGLEAAAKEAQRPHSRLALNIIKEQSSYYESMRVLKENGLRPVTYQEVFVALKRDPKLSEQLKGQWFWLGAIGTSMSGYYVIKSDGSVKRSSPITFEECVQFTKGTNPLSFGVDKDSGSPASRSRTRFSIYAHVDTNVAAPLVVGVPDSTVNS